MSISISSSNKENDIIMKERTKIPILSEIQEEKGKLILFNWKEKAYPIENNYILSVISGIDKEIDNLSQTNIGS